MKHVFAIFFILGTWESVGHAREVIRLEADQWCPYNCNPDDKDHPGFLVEIMQQAFPEYSIEYKLMPWARALRRAEQGDIHGVFGASPGELKDGLYTDTPLAHMQSCLYTRADSPFVYQKPSDLQALVVATIIDYTYAEEIMQAIKDYPKQVVPVGGEDPLATNILKLETKRVDALIEDKNVMSYRLFLNKKQLRLAGCAKPTEIYIAFGAKAPKAKELQAKLNAWLSKENHKKLIQSLRIKYKMIPLATDR